MKITADNIQDGYVNILIDGKKLSIWVNEKSGDVGMWFENGLKPRTIGGNHLQITSTNEKVHRCPHCDGHTTASTFKTMLLPKE